MEPLDFLLPSFGRSSRFPARWERGEVWSGFSAEEVGFASLAAEVSVTLVIGTTLSAEDMPGMHAGTSGPATPWSGVDDYWQSRKVERIVECVIVEESKERRWVMDVEDGKF